MTTDYRIQNNKKNAWNRENNIETNVMLRVLHLFSAQINSWSKVSEKTGDLHDNNLTRYAW